MEPLGTNSFGNDSALEWAGAYREMGLPVAASTLEVALGDAESGGLDPDIAARAIAAAEAVAFALGRGTDKANEVFAGAPSADISAANELVDRCLRFITTVSGGSDAELPAGLRDLQGRLSGDAPVKSAPIPETVTANDEVPADDLKAAIDALTVEVHALRQQTSKNFARLAKLIERRGE